MGALSKDTVICIKSLARPEDLVALAIYLLLHGHSMMDDRAKSRSLRSGESFDIKLDCLFCANYAKSDKKKRGGDVWDVKTFDFQDTIIRKCKERNDLWGISVLGRIEHIIDLPAADAVYHQTCNTNFRTGKDIPLKYQSNKKQKVSAKSPGRPVDKDQLLAFQEIVKYVENSEGNVISVSDLVQKMNELCGDKSYSTKHMKNKLIEHFGTDIVIGNLDGKSDIITLKITASNIIHNFHKCQQNEASNERENILLTAAKLTKNDIQSMQCDKSFYPSSENVKSLDDNLAFLPKGLLVFLNNIFVEKDSKVKIAVIGQAIMQACMPRNVICPLQLGLGVQMHHQFGSKFLVETLFQLGLCSSYGEVQKFEINAAASNTTSFQEYFPGQFMQFVADNVDHNSRTLDGLNTFHGMGMISCKTPGRKTSWNIPRTDANYSQLSEANIEIKYYKPTETTVPPIKFKELTEISPKNKDFFNSANLFVKTIWIARQSRPNWSGFMQTFQQGTHPGEANVTFLPMIDMAPSDLTCINSTLWFVVNQAEKFGVTPVITFDQPLYLKAHTVIREQNADSPLKQIVLRLGGFHMQMSFLGCIGHIFTDTGLQEILETVYAPNAVVHMLTGKSVHRAVRGHFMIDTALHALLMSELYNRPLHTPVSEQLSYHDDENANGSTITFPHSGLTGESEPPRRSPDVNDTMYDVPHDDIEAISHLYDAISSDNATLDDTKANTHLKAIDDNVSNFRQKMKENRTTQLWFQYMDMVSLLQQFLMAERIGDWEGHLSVVKNMLPYFAAAGHAHSLKSCYLYLMDMMNLSTDHPDISEAFLRGLHVVRRTDRFWAGLSTDLIIEQVLMRCLKTSGGLTRGRGLTDNQRTLWILSMPACSDMNAAMQELTGVHYATSDQHKEVGTTRNAKDITDTRTIIKFLSERNPFDEAVQDLRNIETGVFAESTVNIDKAKEVGSSVLKDMKDNNVDDYTFRRADQVIRMNVRSTLKVDNELIEVDPQLLFQRLIAVANRNMPNMPDIFKYELCQVPSSMFDKSGLPREANKPNLSEAIWNMGDCKANTLPQSSTFVLDGGSLLQRIPWKKNSTFQQICQQYLRSIQQHYGNRAIVVFDGYSTSPSLKDVTHMRRTKGKIGTKALFNLDTTFRSDKEKFLNNIENKQNFITILSKYLRDNNVDAIQADDDADTLIVSTAIEESASHDTVVVGEDTDVLVLLCQHGDNSSHNLLYKSDIRRANRTKKVWDIKKTKNVLGPELCNMLPFIHAYTGCDTTSRIYGISKEAVLKLFKTSPEFRQIIEIFNEEEPDINEITTRSEEALILLNNGVPLEGLDILRFRKFTQKVCTSKTCVQVETLPPTTAAFRYHSLRTYLQTQIWRGNNELDAVDWGWEISNNKLLPVRTHLLPAPEPLLKVIRCNCRQNCDSKRCTCRKHGLDCSQGCGACRGNCSNSSTSMMMTTLCLKPEVTLTIIIGIKPGKRIR